MIFHMHLFQHSQSLQLTTACKALDANSKETDLTVEALLDVADILLDLLRSLSVHLHSKCA